MSRSAQRWPVRPLTGLVAVPALAVVGLLLVFASRYGFHRDELYFIQSMHHPAWGYIDNPSLTPAVGWLSQRLFGDSVFGLRVLPAVEVGLVVLVVAALTRELGGELAAQLVAAVVTATSGFVLAIGHLLTTPTLDLLVSCGISLLLVHIVRIGEQRWWIAVGLLVGVGLENKYTLALFLLSLVVGAAVTRTWRGLLSRWTAVGVGVAVLLWLPQLAWQASHGWPQVEFARAVARDQMAENRASLLPFQLVIIGPPMAAFFLAAVWALSRNPRWAPIRFFAAGYAVLLVLLLVTGGKGYYAAGMFGVLIAVGSIATWDWTGRGKGRGRTVWLGAAIGVNLLLGAVITLPVLPPSMVNGPIGALNPDALETIGWPSFVDQIATIALAQPPAQRHTMVIFTADYGEAGAIDRYGPARGIGPAYSGHNSYADFRIPHASDGPVLVIGYDHPDDARDSGVAFHDCTLATTIHTMHGIDNQVNGDRVWICAGPNASWAVLWPSLRHLG